MRLRPALGPDRGGKCCRKPRAGPRVPGLSGGFRGDAQREGAEESQPRDRREQAGGEAGGALGAEREPVTQNV